MPKHPLFLSESYLLRQGLLSCLLGVLLLACGDRQTAEADAETGAKPTELGADTATTPPLLPDTAAIPPFKEDTAPALQPPVQKPAPAQERPPASAKPKPMPAEQPPATAQPPLPADDQIATPPFREGAYRLARVQGETLPLVLDMTPECDTKLLRGDLVLRNGQFRFQSFVVEECAAQAGQEQQQEAQGTYRLEGDRIYLQVETGEVLGDAEGVVEGIAIRLVRISNDAEAQEVDWLFQLQ